MKTCSGCHRVYESASLSCAYCHVTLEDSTYVRACAAGFAAACAWQFVLFVAGQPQERLVQEIVVNASFFIVTGYGVTKGIQRRRDPVRPVLREVETALSDRLMRFALIAAVVYLVLNPVTLAGAWIFAARQLSTAGWDIRGISQALRAFRTPVCVFAPIAAVALLIGRQGARFFDPRVVNSAFGPDARPDPAPESVFLVRRPFDEVFDRLGAHLVEYGFEVRCDRRTGRFVTSPLRGVDELCVPPSGCGRDRPRCVRLELELRATDHGRSTLLSIRPDFVVFPPEGDACDPAPCRSRGILESSIYRGVRKGR